MTLLRMLSGMPKESGGDSVPGFITSLSAPELRSLMITCLQNCEVLLPAGWMPVMTRVHKENEARAAEAARTSFSG